MPGIAGIEAAVLVGGCGLGNTVTVTATAREMPPALVCTVMVYVPTGVVELVRIRA
jgi:hypothetical protein